MAWIINQDLIIQSNHIIFSIRKESTWAEYFNKYRSNCSEQVRDQEWTVERIKYLSKNFHFLTPKLTAIFLVALADLVADLVSFLVSSPLSGVVLSGSLSAGSLLAGSHWTSFSGKFELTELELCQKVNGKQHILKSEI